jgi:hypothetical protein
VPSGVVTVTWTVPVPAGLVAVIIVRLSTVTLVALADPKETVEPFTNPVPLIVTVVPPASGPVDGETDVTVGTPAYVNWSAGEVALVPPDVVTAMSTVPVPAGLVAVMSIGLETTTLVAWVGPNETVAPVAKPVPLIVTVVPPTCGPADGDTDVTVGTVGRTVKVAVAVSVLDTPVAVIVTGPAASCAGIWMVVALQSPVPSVTHDPICWEPWV